MKKIIIGLMFILILVVGCKTGQVYRPPGDLLAVERTIAGNQVTLAIDAASELDANEIIIIADKLPEGATYDDGSASIAPTFSSDKILTWLFKKPGSADQVIGSLTVSTELPSQLGYSIYGTAADGSVFKGKWGLKLANKEGLFVEDNLDGCTADCSGKACGDDGCGGSCGTCSTGQVCQNGNCNVGTIPNRYDLNGDNATNLLDLGRALDMWGQTYNEAEIDLIFLGGILDNWS